MTHKVCDGQNNKARRTRERRLGQLHDINTQLAQLPHHRQYSGQRQALSSRREAIAGSLRMDLGAAMNFRLPGAALA